MRAWILAAAVAMAAYAALLMADQPVIAQFVKPVPVALLALGVAVKHRSMATRWLAVGLGMSAIADGAIEMHFLAGLAVFLAAHLAYIASFILEAPRLALLRGLPFLAVVVGAGSVFVPAAGDLGVPVAVYAAVIGIMGWRAAARAGSGRAGWIGLAGAVLFMASDIMLATHQFVSPVPYRTLLVMSTYWAGQVLIALSAPNEP